MVNPAHIQDAERIGMPEDKPVRWHCRQCGKTIGPDEVQECDECGRSCCSKCCHWIPSIALRFCGKECAIGKLLVLLETAERPITDHPDVQRLIGQVVELQILVNDLLADKERLIGQVVELQAENKAKNKRIKELEKNQFPSEPICEECGKPRKCLGIIWDKHYEPCKRTT